MPTAPRIHVENLVGSIWLITLRGDHDIATAGELAQALDEALGDEARAILDLSEAAFVDSTIVHTILARLPQDRGDPHLFVVARGDSPALRVFTLSGVAQRIPLCDGIPQALEWIAFSDWDVASSDGAGHDHNPRGE